MKPALERVWIIYLARVDDEAVCAGQHGLVENHVVLSGSNPVAFFATSHPIRTLTHSISTALLAVFSCVISERPCSSELFFFGINQAYHVLIRGR